jgi:hypothetical protein
MKRFVVLLLLLIPVIANAQQDLIVEWDPYTDERADSLRIYIERIASGDVYTINVSTELTEHTVSANRFYPAEQYRLWMTAFNAYVESMPNTPILFTTPERELFDSTENPLPMVIQVPGTVSTITIQQGGD